jgi:hypothetical protein
MTNALLQMRKEESNVEVRERVRSGSSRSQKVFPRIRTRQLPVGIVRNTRLCAECRTALRVRQGKYCEHCASQRVLRSHEEMRSGKGKFGSKWKANLLKGLK